MGGGGGGEATGTLQARCDLGEALTTQLLNSSGLSASQLVGLRLLMFCFYTLPIFSPTFMVFLLPVLVCYVVARCGLSEELCRFVH